MTHPPTTDSPHIPSHLSEFQFRRYEPYLSRALRDWPQDSRFDCPEELAVTSFIARFRDSILSVLRFGWEPTRGNEIDLLLLRDLSEKRAFTIAADPGTRTVWFRKKVRPSAPMAYCTPDGAARKAGARANGVASSPSQGPVQLLDITDAELCSWFLLVNNSRIEGPILLSGDFTNHPFYLDGQYKNISLFYDKEKHITVLT